MAAVNTRAIGLFLVLAVLALPAGARAAEGAAGGPGTVSGCSAGWRSVPTPDVGEGQFFGVAATSPTDAWAVGATFAGGGPYLQLIEHWDGSKWNVVPSPPVLRPSKLVDVAAVTPTDAWAVGTVFGGGLSEPLLEHWDGRSWRRVAVPVAHVGLTGVSAASARDVWAVGSDTVLHWGGTRWTGVAGLGVDLTDVVAVTGRDVWVVGVTDQAFAAHWDGRRWRRFRLGQPADPGANAYVSLMSVTAATANDVWAGGGYEEGNTIRQPILYRWRGRRWERQRLTPRANGAVGELYGIVARSTTDVWAVAWDDPVVVGDGSTIPHWNGKNWASRKPVLGRALWAVASDRGAHLWAVGSTGNPTYDGDTATPTPLIQRHAC
jgi:hypothetical protein